MPPEFHDRRTGEVVEHPAPLEYDRWPKAGMKRLAVVDPQAPIKQHPVHNTERSARDDYWSPEIRQTRSHRTGKPLKTPRVAPNPNVVDPHTVAFADYHEPSPGRLYLDYVTTRWDQAAQGHASRLIQEVAQRHPEHELDFGRVMSPKVWSQMEKLRQAGRTVHGKKDF